MPASSDLGTILAAVQTAAQALSLTGINSADIKIKKFAWRRGDITVPGVVICPIQERLPNEGTNAADDTDYGVQVSAVVTSNSDNSLDAASQLLEWRKLLIERFREKRITSISGLDHYTTRVEPGPVIDAAAFAAGYDATTIYLRVKTRKVRA